MVVVVINMELKEIDINKIKPNPMQPRERFDTVKLNQLADSIKQVGLVQPIIVEEKSKGEFEIISGERRWKAHSKAKLKSILALVKKYDEDLQKKKELLAGNLNRENLSDWEEWSYIKSVALAEGWVHEKDERNARKGEMNLKLMQASLGIDFNRLRMLQATFEGTSKELQEAVKKGKITTSDAQSISSLGKDEQEKLAKEAISREEGMRRSEIRSTIKEIKADKIKEEYGVESFELEESEQDIINDYLTKLSELDEIHSKVKKKGLDTFDNSSLRRIATSMVVKFSNLLDFYDYGIRPDKRFLKLVNYGKEISK